MNEKKSEDEFVDEGFNEDFEFGEEKGEAKTKPSGGRSAPSGGGGGGGKTFLSLVIVVIVIVLGYFGYKYSSKKPQQANNLGVTMAAKPTETLEAAQEDISKELESLSKETKEAPKAPGTEVAKAPVSPTTPVTPATTTVQTTNPEHKPEVTAAEQPKVTTTPTVATPTPTTVTPATHAPQKTETGRIESMQKELFTPTPETPKPGTNTQPPGQSQTAKQGAAASNMEQEQLSINKLSEQLNAVQQKQSQEEANDTKDEAKLSEAIDVVVKLNKQMENSLNQIKYLEAYTREISDTISKLNSSINAMDSRMLALTNTANLLSKDVGSVRSEVGSFKRAFGDEGLDLTSVPIRERPESIKAPCAQDLEYVVHAVIPGRAWLKNLKGQIITVTEGDLVGNYGRVLVIDPTNGVVLTNSGITFR